MNQKSASPHGIIVAMATPFDNQDRLDRTAIARLVEHLIAGGVHGIFAAGSQGESYALNDQERHELIETTASAVSGRVPVYAGVCAITTRDAIKQAQIAEAAGADILSVLTPFFVRPSRSELLEYFTRVAESTRLPLVLYNNPDKTGVKINPDLLGELEKTVNVVGIKDSSGDMTLTIEYIRSTSEDFAVMAGRDTLIYPTLVCGGAGAVTATANVVPGLCVQIYESYRSGDGNRALAAQKLLNPLRLAFGLGTFPVVVKEALSIIGIPVGPARAPVRELDQSSRQQLTRVLQPLQDYWRHADAGR